MLAKAARGHTPWRPKYFRDEMHRLCLQGLHTWTYSKGAIRRCVRCQCVEVRTNDGWDTKVPKARPVQGADDASGSVQ